MIRDEQRVGVHADVITRRGQAVAKGPVSGGLVMVQQTRSRQDQRTGTD